MVIWAASTLVPDVQGQGLFKVVPLSPMEWLLAVGVAVIGTLWIEARKLIAVQHLRS